MSVVGDSTAMILMSDSLCTACTAHFTFDLYPSEKRRDAIVDSRSQRNCIESKGRC